MEVELWFRQPMSAVGLNGRAHWAMRARLVRGYRREAEARVIELLRGLPDNGVGFVPRVYDVLWVCGRGGMPDADNALGRCKAIVDGMCDGLWVDDRDLELGRVQRVRPKRGDELWERRGMVMVRMRDYVD